MEFHKIPPNLSREQNRLFIIGKVMTKGELELNRDEIVTQIQEYQGQLRTVDEDLAKFDVAKEEASKYANEPVQMYQDYKRW